MPQKIAAGNWKMNGLTDDLTTFTDIAEAVEATNCQVIICPPATLVSDCAKVRRAVSIGGQDCHAKESGAHTGDISASMLKAAGADYVIVGHSERRTDHGETDAMIVAKAMAANDAGLSSIICIGETLDQREDGTTLDALDEQLQGSVPDRATRRNTVIAYEPVWAIGTGKVPSVDQIAEVHDHLRARLSERFGDNGFSLLYGGSVKGSNAAEIFAVSNVDGALVGGASLNAEDFAPIVTALDAS